MEKARNILLTLFITINMGLLSSTTWNYSFGTGTGSHTSGTSNTFLPVTETNGGSRYVRIGSGSGSINLENPGLASLGSDTELRAVAPTTASVNKFSVFDYTPGKSFYTKFNVLFGNSTGANTVASGTFSFWQGDGAMYSDVNSFTGAQAFTGIRWIYGASGAITTSYRTSAWTALGSTPFVQASAYTVEIFGNNTTATINYDYSGNSNSLAANKQDIWINGILIGDDLAKAGIGNDVNIDSWMFYGESSTGNAANIFVDDFTYRNDLPTASLATEPTAQPTSLGFSNITAGSFDVAYSAAAGLPAGYLAVRKTGSTPTGSPIDGKAYAANDTLGTDGVVVYSGSGTTFTQSSLTPSTSYYYKIFAYNGSGVTTNYLQTGPLAGSQATLAGVVPPTVTTAIITGVGVTTASGGGEVTSLGGGTVTARGICWNTTGTPTIISDTYTTNGSGIGAYTSTLTPLSANTLYYVRAYATNGAGTAYGSPVTFTTLKTEPANHVTSFAAGTLTSSTIDLSWVDAINTDAYLIKGSSMSFGDIVSPADGIAETNGTLTQNVTQGTQLYTFTGLNSLTTYYFKIFPYNTNGTGNNYKSDGTVPQITAQTAATTGITAGSIAAIAFQSDDMDQFAFVPLVNIPEATVINFTDNAWTGTALASTEGTLAWTAPIGGTTRGTAVTITANDASWSAPICSSGTVVKSGNPAFSTSGDQLIAYTGLAASPTFLYALSTTLWLTTGATTATQSYLPTGLTDGTTALAFTPEMDDQYYNVVNFNGTEAELLASVSNASNWLRSDTRYASLPAWTFTLGEVVITEPTAQPTSIGFNTVTSNSYNVTFTAASPSASYYLAVRKPGSAPTTDPSDGSAYTAGTTLGDGVVAYSGSGVSFSESGLSTSTTYYYKIYSFNGTGSATNYLIISPLAGSQTTSSAVVAPSVTTTPVTSIAQTTASSGGNVTADGGAAVTARGVCWNTSINPTTANSQTSDASGTGIFTSSLTSLTPNTLYHVRAYATNSVNTSYGDDVTFTTLAVAPAAPVATAATSVTNSSFISNWNVSSGATSYRLDVSTVDTFVSFVTGYNDLTVNATTQSVSGLTASTTYFYRVRAVNTGGASISSNTITQATTATDPFGGYYNSVAGLTGTALKGGLHTIIHSTHTTQFGYADLETQLKVTDEDPYNTNNILELYTGWSVPKSAYGGGVTDWNKEHVWSKSHGFSDAAPAGSDLHHLRPSDATVNSAKNNRDFDEGTTPYTDASPYGSYSAVTGCYTSTDIWEPREVEKGDVARMIFYMAVRYDGVDTSYDLELLDSVPTTGPYYGKLSTLLVWNAQDPPDAWEALRNNRIQGLQGNRNPFIDHPEYVTSIWGGAPSVPTVTTAIITSIATTTASCGGNVTNDGGVTVSARGVCWNTTGTPIVTDSHTTDSSGTGVFTSSLTALTAGTLYYVRAYATNSVGTAYGDPVQFTTLKNEPANHVTSFAAGTTTSTTIPLTWTDAANTDTYLIKGSSVDFASITAPVDGTAEADGALVRNIAQTVQTYTFTGLTASTTYYFKIYPYNNTTTNVNYKTDGTVPQISATTAAVSPSLEVTPATMTFSSNIGVASAYQTATVASSNLSAGISVSSAGPFTFSLTSGGAYSNPLVLANDYNGSVYIKFTPPAAQTYTDAINFVSGVTIDTIMPTAVGTTPSTSLLLEENFDYTTGTLLTANGWTNHSGTSNYIPVSSTGLTYTGYPASGGSASLLTSGEDVNRTFVSQTSGSVYASALINVTSSQTTGDYLFHFGTNTWTSTFVGRLFIKKDTATTNFAMGLTRGAAIASAVFTGYNYVPGTTYLVVLKYTFVAGTTNDEVNLFINPAFPGTEPTSDLTVSTTDISTEPSNIGGVGLRQGTSTNAAAALIDGIRVATSWAALFPASSAPAKPVVTISQSSDQITLAWAAVPTATSYRVEAADTYNGTFADVTLSGTLLLTGGTYTWTTPAVDTVKFYEVYAGN